MNKILILALVIMGYTANAQENFLLREDIPTQGEYWYFPLIDYSAMSEVYTMSQIFSDSVDYPSYTEMRLVRIDSAILKPDLNILYIITPVDGKDTQMFMHYYSGNFQRTKTLPIRYIPNKEED